MIDYREDRLEENKKLYKLYENNFGKIKTPNALAEFFIFTGRQRGKTYQLVHSLPEGEKVVVVAHNIESGKHIKDMLQRERPTFDVKNVEFVSMGGTRKMTHKIIQRPESTTIIDERPFHLLKNKQEMKNVMKGLNWNEDVLIWKQYVDIKSFGPMIMFLVKDKSKQLYSYLGYVAPMEIMVKDDEQNETEQQNTNAT